MNTRIGYMYRDGANYKQYCEVVVAGTLDPTLVTPLLDGGQWFIAGDVGLPDPQLEWEELGYEFPTEEDHVFCEFDPEDVEPTEAPPTVGVTAADLLARLRAIGGRWDAEAAMRRFGFGDLPVPAVETRVVRVRAAGHDGWAALVEVPADATEAELQKLARRVACVDAPSALFLARPELLVEEAKGEPTLRFRFGTTGKWHRVGEWDDEYVRPAPAGSADEAGGPAGG